MSGIRLLTIPFALAIVGLVAPAGEPIPATLVKLNRPTGNLGEVLKEFTVQTGVVVDASAFDPATPCGVDFDGTSLWKALEFIAEKARARIVLGQNGRRVSLVKSSGRRVPSSVDGAFRVVVKEVQCKTDFESGKSVVDVVLDIHWEPRIPVFRIDSQPSITALSADAGAPKTVTARAKTPPNGRSFTTAVRIEGIPRSATVIRQLAGEFTVTATPRMLRFDFPDLMNPKAIALPEQSGVIAALKPIQKLDNSWEFPVELTYPARPEFESFESWVTENRLQLIDPTGRAVEPADFDIPDQGRRVSALYRFPAEPAKHGIPANRKGWTAVYYAPAPLVEFSVKFDLKDIPLP